jgi:hypothetical protein
MDFLAHEVSSIVPEAITGEKDGVDEEGNPSYQGIKDRRIDDNYKSNRCRIR